MTLKDFINDINNDDDLISKLWNSDLEISKKVLMTFEFDNLDYSALNNLWMYYSIAGRTKENDELIFKKYQTELSNPDKELSATYEYSLYFDIFEDPERNQLAWKYFLSHNPNELFLRVMLTNSGPVPYELKDKLYHELLAKKSFHLEIYKSIRHSCFDNCGLVDKFKARDILYRLKLDDIMEEMDREEHFPKYAEVANYLK